ncbi:MAG: xanthine dehydrogenase family protein subunit M [Candidatus Rokuibacteriota bacterium]
MKPAPFRYARPRTVADTVGALAEAGGEAKILAGGQSLVPMLNMRLARPALVIDLNGVEGLGAITPSAAGGLRIGALARHADLAASPLVRARAPLLAQAARHIGHTAIRNRGTLGGSLAHADPAAELPAAVVALDASLIVVGRSGTRMIPAGDFFVGLLTTALEADEILTEVHVPPPRGAWGFAEIARRPGDFALVGLAAVLVPAAAAPSRLEGARLVAFGVGDGPVRLTQAERALAGAAPDAAAARAAALAAGEGCTPADDVHASAEYRRHLVTVLAEQVVLEAIARLAPPR